MRKIFTFLLLFQIFSFKLLSQNGQTVRGRIVDSFTSNPIIGASVSIIGTKLGSITDSTGNYKINNVPSGRYQIKINAINYSKRSLYELVVDLSKEKIADFNLQERANDLAEVIVHPINSGTVNLTSSRTFTVEETQRFAASFYDPARLVASFPGITTTNDQGNNISVRGNSPNALAWRLEGVEIVNPNHLTNAGTANDRPMQNGGGTIVLSAQMLDNSQFLSGAFSPEYGGSVAGLFDMRLRKGNNQKREYTVQAGFLGVDLSAEGPISKNSKASYLLNYRYSFTGLLNAFGVPLGDEKIAYQDIALNISLPTKKLGNFTLFGIYGASSNDFEITDETKKIFAKDYSIINFNAKFITFGSTHEVPIGKKASLRSVIALSEKQNNRSELEYSKRVSSYSGPVFDNLSNQRISFNSTLNYKLSSANKLKVGVYISNINDQSAHGDLSKPSPYYLAKMDGMLIQPFVNLQSNISTKFALNLGLHYQHLTSNKTESIEPRASLSYKISEKSNLNFAYSLQGQMQLVAAYGPESNPGFIAVNRNLKFSQAHHYVIGYNKIFGESTRLKAELFLQNHFNVLTTVTESPLSGMNLIDEYQLTVPLNNVGLATNKGVELSVEKYFQKKYYYLVSTTLYDAKYKGSNGIEINSRFNGKYAANFTAGKEWDWNKKNKIRIIGLNIRGIFQGGYSESPIDVESSRFFQRSLSFNNTKNIFTVKLPDYSRFDLRLSVKKQKPNYTRTLSLDIQNFTNHLNTAYFYFDWAQNKVIEKKQLGMIPVFNWRVEF